MHEVFLMTRDGRIMKRPVMTGLAVVFLLGALGPMVAEPAAAANQFDIGTNWIYS
jgi:hypothetical protein